MPPPPPVISATLPSSLISDQSVMAVNVRLVAGHAAVEHLLDGDGTLQRIRLANGECRGQVEQALGAACLWVIAAAARAQEIERCQREGILEAVREKCFHGPCVGMFAEKLGG